MGADCIEKKMSKYHIEKVNLLLKKSNITKYTYKNFKRYGSSRKLYNFKIDNLSSY